MHPHLKKTALLTGVIALASTLSGCAGMPPQTVSGTSSASSYFPLTQGSWWRYESERSSDGPAAKMWHELRVLKPDQYPRQLPPGIDEANVFVVQMRDLPNPKTTSWDSLPEPGPEVAMRNRYYSIGNGMARLNYADGTSYKPPRPEVPLEPKSGESWLYDGVQYRVTLKDNPESGGKPQAEVLDNQYFTITTFEKGTGLTRIAQAEGHKKTHQLSTVLIESHIEP